MIQNCGCGVSIISESHVCCIITLQCVLHPFNAISVKRLNHSSLFKLLSRLYNIVMSHTLAFERQLALTFFFCYRQGFSLRVCITLRGAKVDNHEIIIVSLNSDAE
jgi:hypothetical protein